MTKTYSITAYYKNWFHCEVQADNEQQAREIALENTNWEHLESEEHKIPTIEDIEEVDNE